MQTFITGPSGIRSKKMWRQINNGAIAVWRFLSSRGFRAFFLAVLLAIGWRGSWFILFLAVTIKSLYTHKRKARKLTGSPFATLAKIAIAFATGAYLLKPLPPIAQIAIGWFIVALWYFYPELKVWIKGSREYYAVEQKILKFLDWLAPYREKFQAYEEAKVFDRIGKLRDEVIDDICRRHPVTVLAPFLAYLYLVYRSRSVFIVFAGAIFFAYWIARWRMTVTITSNRRVFHLWGVISPKQIYVWYSDIRVCNANKPPLQAFFGCRWLEFDTAATNDTILQTNVKWIANGQLIANKIAQRIDDAKKPEWTANLKRLIQLFENREDTRSGRRFRRHPKRRFYKTSDIGNLENDD